MDDLYGEYEKAINLLEKTRKYLKMAGDEAEVKYDDYGEHYMDPGLWEIMVETKEILNEIDGALKKFRER